MDWNGIMKIVEINHFNKNNELIWQAKNIRNILHQEGEEFVLRAVFTGGQTSTVIPENYYLGLDNRVTISATNTMDDLLGEPQSGGYARQAVSSAGDFSVALENNENFVATSPIVAFRATTATWGPVSHLFLTDREDNAGALISSASLPTPVTVEFGDTITMRLSMQLKDCLSDGT